MQTGVSMGQDEFLAIGDSIAAGYGPSKGKDLASLIAHHFKCVVDVVTKPFAGITAVPKLLRQVEGFRYRAIILSAGGNDAICPDFFFNTIERNLRESIRIALTMTDNLVIITNVSGLGQVYPVWSLRRYFRWRAKAVEKSYSRVFWDLRNDRRITVIAVDDILSAEENLACDGVHPNERAHQAIFDCIRDHL